MFSLQKFPSLKSSMLMSFFFILQDAFVLCKVTQRIDWTSENGNEVGNNNHHPQQSNVAATSAVSVEQPDAAASSAVGAEQPSDVATLAITAHTTPDGDDEIQEWLEALIDPNFDPSLTTVVDPVSAGLSLDEQNAESSVCSYHFQSYHSKYSA
jgi:hypothetical protein